METKIKELKDSLITKIEEIFDEIIEEQPIPDKEDIIQVPDQIKLVFTPWSRGIINTDGQLLYYDKSVKYKVLNSTAFSAFPHKLISCKFKDVPIGEVFLGEGLENKNCIEFYYIKMSDKYSLYWDLKYDIWFPQPELFDLDEDVYLAEQI